MNSPRNYFRNWFYPKRKITDMPSWCLSSEENKILKRIDIYAGKIDNYVRKRVDETRKGNAPKKADFLRIHIEEFLKDEAKSDDEIKLMSIRLIRH